MSVQDALNQIGSADPKQRLLAQLGLVDQFVAERAVESLQELLVAMLNADVPLVQSRPVLVHMARSIEKLDNEALRQVAETAIERLRERLVSFEEPDALFRDSLSEVYMALGRYTDAAKVLTGINMESGGRNYSAEEKANRYVKIAELFLQDDETVDAEIYLNRASVVMSEVSDWALELRYKVSLARILDAKRKFIEAAARYYQLSQRPPGEVDEADIERLLQSALVCAILGKAGPQRSRMLGTLYKDERTRALEHFGVLEKMYMERLLRRPEIAKFESALLPHQKAMLADGSTVVERSVTEHNLLAASKVYRNVTLGELGSLLEVPPEQAEKAAARMISEGRMRATIDQVDSVLRFESGSTAAELQAWDGQISDLLFAVSQSVESVHRAFPDNPALRELQ